MGRRKQRTAEDTRATGAGLEQAWSSSPTRPPRYVLKCYNHETGKLYLVNSYALYAARKIFDAVVGAKNWTRTGNKVECHDIDIVSDEMEKIATYEYKPQEKAWDLPLPYPHDINQFLHGPRVTRERDDEGKAAPLPPPVPKEAKKKIDRSNKITVQEICDELKMLPRDARAILRKAKVEKPLGGWIGDSKWAADIKTILIKGKKK